MKNFYASTIGEISVHPADKMSFYIGEDDLMVKMYADPLCAHGPLSDVSIKVYDRPELDNLAYKVRCMQYNEARLENPDKKDFLRKRKSAYNAYVARVSKMTKLAERIEGDTGRQTDLYRKGDGTLTLLVDTNYDGPYPPKETYEAIAKVSRIAGNKKHLKMWTHPMKVCCYISDHEGGENA